jgi:hypothetical protein
VVKGPPEHFNCFLKSKGTESGVWSVHIHAPAKTEQAQADASISYPLMLKEKTSVKLTYRTEPQTEKPAAPCLGAADEPFAEPGNLCTYRGFKEAGSKEAGVGVGNVDKSTKFERFSSAEGEGPLTTTGLANAGDIGLDLVFRTNEFSTETPITELATESNLTAKGSWAVTAP